jgi:hypothetical protein
MLQDGSQTDTTKIAARVLRTAENISILEM